MAFVGRHVFGGIALFLLSAIPGCSGEGTDESDLDGAPLKTYWADAKKLDLSDLTRVAAGYATDGINDTLRLGPVNARFDKPSVFAAKAEPNTLLEGNTVKGIDQIVTGLASAFGERELGTQVNAIRLKHLEAGDDKYFVESAFTLHGGFSTGWNFKTGLPGGAGVSLGLDAGADLVSRVILASSKDNVVKVLKAPLAAAVDMRGFVFPRSIDDIEKMRPGEMFALRGLGKLGMNVGLGIPVLFQTYGVYNIVASVGVSTVIGGQIDVQLVRLEGDEVVVDVGIENGRALSASVGVSDSFGIKGICDDGISCLRPVDIAGVAKVDLTQEIAKAVDKEVNKYLTFSVSAGAGISSSRTSLSRIRFHLDRGNRAEVGRALEHALHFDVRLAQAMYNRDLGEAAPAVVADYDAVRASTTSHRNFGFELLGMNMYHHAVVEKEGTFVVQTPAGMQTVLFDSINKHGGWFQRDHGFTRVGLAAQTLDAKNPSSFRSEANLFMQTAVSDKHMGNDMIVDNIDATLSAVIGHKGIEALDTYGNRIQQVIWEHCRASNSADERTVEQCNLDMLDEPYIASLRTIGLGAIEPFIERLPADFKDLVRKLATTRLILQSVAVHDFDVANGPNVSFTLDSRLDDKALGILTSKSKAQYREALREYLTAVYADRLKVKSSANKDAVRADVDRKWSQRMDEMADIFEVSAKEYRSIANAESKIPAALAGKRFTGSPLGVRFAVEHAEARAYEKALLVSTSHDRALAAARLFDGLRGRAVGMNAPLHPEHTAAFPLLGLLPTENLQLGVDFRADTSSTFWTDFARFKKAGLANVSAPAKGSQVALISSGMFNLDAILAGN